MKIALCTTTINVPRVLSWYRAAADTGPDPFDHPGVTSPRFFVAFDEKTDPGAYIFCSDVGNTKGISLSEQKAWKCFEPIGPNSIQKRNIAFLEALKWGAEIIVSVDDDNLPLTNGYFSEHQCGLDTFDGIKVIGKNGWVDPGEYLRPKAKHRGFPTQVDHHVSHVHAIHERVGVSAGMCMLDPDVDAATRIVAAPDIQQVSVLAESGFIVHNSSWTVFNSQNTAIRREFVPAWGMVPHTGRYDDIYASLIVQRVMRDRGAHVHFGRPFVFQDRNEHNLIKDLRLEVEGMENLQKVARVLDHTILSNKSVIDDCRQIWRTLSTTDIFPGQSIKAMEAWLSDCEGVL